MCLSAAFSSTYSLVNANQSPIPPAQEVTTFLRVLGCYPREMSSLALQSVDLPDPIADAGAAWQHDTLYGSDELLFALASATGRRPDQVRRQQN